MGATEGMSFLSLRALNTVTVTLALGLVALVGWHAQNPAHFELIQVPARPARLRAALSRRPGAQEVLEAVPKELSRPGAATCTAMLRHRWPPGFCSPLCLLSLPSFLLTLCCSMTGSGGLQSKAAAVPVQQTTELSFLQTSSKFMLCCAA